MPPTAAGGAAAPPGGSGTGAGAGGAGRILMTGGTPAGLAPPPAGTESVGGCSCSRITTWPLAFFETSAMVNSPFSPPLKVAPALTFRISLAVMTGAASARMWALTVPLNSLSDLDGLSPFFRWTAVSC